MCEKEGYTKREIGKLSPPVEVCLKLTIHKQERPLGLPYNCYMAAMGLLVPHVCDQDFFNSHTKVHSTY